MRNSMASISFLFVVLFAASLVTMSCGSKKEQSTEEHEHAEGDTTSHHHDEMEKDSTEMHDMDSTPMAYACPMHPEVTGKEGDKCSKCGMKLEPVKEHKDDHEH
ncbi:MAG: hypothetical protein KF775_13670 [Cyclobacteriaceae bacterium]|nr:hypothetical protein [Cyclobacteriaceae bacterium]